MKMIIILKIAILERRPCLGNLGKDRGESSLYMASLSKQGGPLSTELGWYMFPEGPCENTYHIQPVF